MRKRLTQMQETFCLKYFELGNASEAATIAGYSTRSIRNIASVNLTKTNIIKRIDQLRQAAEDASIASVVERKQRLTEIARANIPDYVQEDGIRLNGQSPNTGAVSEITTKTKMLSNGPAVITNLKLHNPIQAIAELNKMDGAYAPIKMSGADGEPLIPPMLIFRLPDGVYVKPPRQNGHAPLLTEKTEVMEGGNGDKPAED